MWNALHFTLWGWRRLLAPKGSSLASTQLQRRRPTASHSKKRKWLEWARNSYKWQDMSGKVWTWTEKYLNDWTFLWMDEKVLEWPKRAVKSWKPKVLPAAPAAVNSNPAILLDICGSLSAIVQFGYQSICWESLDVARQHCQCAKQDWAQLWVCVKMSPGRLVLLWLLQARVTEPTLFTLVYCNTQNLLMGGNWFPNVSKIT